jgi:Flp pilus assembly pilin Flp
MRLIEALSHAVTYFMPDEAGASLLECALVGMLIAVVCILALLALGKTA